MSVPATRYGSDPSVIRFNLNLDGMYRCQSNLVLPFLLVSDLSVELKRSYELRLPTSSDVRLPEVKRGYSSSTKCKIKYSTKLHLYLLHQESSIKHQAYNYKADEAPPQLSQTVQNQSSPQYRFKNSTHTVPGRAKPRAHAPQPHEYQKPRCGSQACIPLSILQPSASSSRILG
ncbi:predicted protein [Sclerotinia sclerotiorum 1980 UF-70]|uniref:Uncharacterized protein n=1 Tax=Sclerotinia sclerotiorum (strain ATCC 18683 / 1980 / Ss-1) TaxID=665079 RepID=A7EGE8_SCLS1|nr:predicted protein [Sclerotinia sclerotiorum 1980 UF-70]EDO01914.1 predicted protein [Sclerotinia sclerotiorum 1980 UF-70]